METVKDISDLIVANRNARYVCDYLHNKFWILDAVHTHRRLLAVKGLLSDKHSPPVKFVSLP